MSTADQIRALQKERECGIQEAKDVLVGRDLLVLIELADTVKDLKFVLRTIVKRIYPE